MKRRSRTGKMIPMSAWVVGIGVTLMACALDVDSLTKKAPDARLQTQDGGKKDGAGPGSDDAAPEDVPLAVTSIVPSNSVTGSANVTLEVQGTGFLPGAFARFNLVDLPTTWKPEGLVVGPLTLPTVAGVYTLTVINPTGEATFGNFTVNNPSPAVTQVRASLLKLGATGVTVFLDGTGFLNGSSARFGGANYTLQGTSTGASFGPVALPLQGGFLPVVVSNPAPTVAEVATSLRVPWPEVKVLQVAQSHYATGATNVEVTLEGKGFAPGATVSLPPEFGASGSASVAVLGETTLRLAGVTLPSSPGDYVVTVQNPEPFEGLPSTGTVRVLREIASCKEEKRSNPAAVDGDYLVQGNGTDRIMARCDMTQEGGGWVLVGEDTFENGAAGWRTSGASTSQGTTTCGTNVLLGGYGVLGGGASVTKTFTTSWPHDEVRLDVDIMKIDSWDNESVNISVDQNVVVTQQFTGRDGTQLCGSTTSTYRERLASLRGIGLHKGATLDVKAATTLNEGPTNESWGLKRVRVWVREGSAGAPGCPSGQANYGQGCEALLPSCHAIHSAYPQAASGDFLVDPDGPATAWGPMTVSCDMATAGGGWSLALNYRRASASNPTLTVRNAYPPLRAADTLGGSDDGTPAWGHAGTRLLAAMDPDELRFYCATTGHNRVMSFRTGDTVFLSGAKAGSAWLPPPQTWTLLPDHTARLPDQPGLQSVGAGGEQSLTSAPFFVPGLYHWDIALEGLRWECDDFADIGNATLHRVWVRSKIPVITGLVASSTTPGATGVGFTVSGRNFLPGAKVNFNGTIYDAALSGASLTVAGVTLPSSFPNAGAFPPLVVINPNRASSLPYEDLVCPAGTTDSNGAASGGRCISNGSGVGVVACDAGYHDSNGTAAGGTCLANSLSGTTEYCDFGYVESFRSGFGGDCNPVPASCSEVLAQDPGAMTGTYTIDPDGGGPLAPRTVTCDMDSDGGGWTEIVAEGFDQVPAGWTVSGGTAKANLCGKTIVLGGPGAFSGATRVSKTFSIPVPFDEVSVTGTMVGVDLWDVNRWSLEANGKKVYETTFSGYRGADLCGATGPGNLDVEENFGAVFRESSPSLTLSMGGTGGPSWGLGAVRIAVRTRPKLGSGCPDGQAKYGTSSCRSILASCSEIHDLFPALASGKYVIDPDGTSSAFSPMMAECDMSEAQGGWTLVLNYNHAAGSTAGLLMRHGTLPVMGETALGWDESYSMFWGHGTPALVSALNPKEVRFECQSSGHARKVHFATKEPHCLAYLKTGTGQCAGLGETFYGYSKLSGHTAVVPSPYFHGGSNFGLRGATSLLFGSSGNSWSVDYMGDWDCDDLRTTNANDTSHRMWVRTRPPDPAGPSAYPKTCNDSLAPKKDGTYTIAVDPDGLGSIPAQTVTCQKETVLTTDRYWTLVGNYVHLGGTTPGYFVRTTFPVQKASGYGSDESALKGPSEAWGHLHAHSLALLQPTELRFECKTSNHNRVVDFATKNAGCLTYATTGIGSCYVAGAETRVLATSSGNPFLPTLATESWQHDFVILGYEPSLAFQTFFKGSTPQARWNIGTWGTQRWECDDAPENSAASTVHRIWILGPP